jgi:RimJ/RimL family protein N-acetyltransferase
MEIPVGRYLVRPWQPKDATSLSTHLGNPKVTEQLLARHPNPYTVERALQWIELCRMEADPVNFAIANKTDAIGGVSLYLQRGVRRHSAEIGFWIGEPFWNQGIATQVVQAFVDYAFTRFALTRVFANVFSANTASIRVLEKAGFLYEGMAVKSVNKDERFMDELSYAIVR